MGGQFIEFIPNGGTSVIRNAIARLEIDGRVERTINLNIVGSSVLATALQRKGVEVTVYSMNDGPADIRFAFCVRWKRLSLTVSPFTYCASVPPGTRPLTRFSARVQL